MTTATAEPLTVQQAFEAAKAEHSAPVQNEPATAEVSPGPEGTATQPDEAQVQPPATDSTTPEISDLITDDELATLKTTHANDPDALAKELKAVFTKKTQSLAEQRKAVEKLAGYQPFIDALENPATRADALKAAAEQLGFTLAPKAVETAATEHATKTAETLADDVVAQFRTALGPELDFLADKLAPAIQALAQQVAAKAIEPVKSSHQTLLDKAAEEQRGQVMQAFEKAHPDWKQHEPAMTSLMAKLQPNGMEPGEYLDTLYTLATKDVREAETAKKTVARMVKVAAEDEGKTTPLSGDRVTEVLPDVSDPDYVRKAFQAAKREVEGRRG